MAGNLEQFDANGALPEDLAHEIFETVRTLMMNFADYEQHTKEDVHRAANTASRAIQASVANHMAAIQWKMLNRRKLMYD